jgi:hypothetical protein
MHSEKGPDMSRVLPSISGMWTPDNRYSCVDTAVPLADIAGSEHLRTPAGYRLVGSGKPYPAMGYWPSGPT